TWVRLLAADPRPLPAALPTELVDVYLRDDEAMPQHDCGRCGLWLPVRPGWHGGHERAAERVYFRACPTCGGPTGLYAYWARADERMGRLRRLGVRPIVGLIHHGSGPGHTSLLDPGFPGGLAAFAARVAGRYPWADAYTPVNEPLTTARFSALYGHWYPHARDNRTFATAILTQCRAIVLAMDAIRCVQPQARLIQTDDLGKTYSTPKLRYQANFENQRRWLTF